MSINRIKAVKAGDVNHYILIAASLQWGVRISHASLFGGDALSHIMDTINTLNIQNKKVSLPEFNQYTGGQTRDNPSFRKELSLYLQNQASSEHFVLSVRLLSYFKELIQGYAPSAWSAILESRSSVTNLVQQSKLSGGMTSHVRSIDTRMRVNGATQKKLKREVILH